MKTIGRSFSDGVLLEVSLEEYAALRASALALSGLPELLSPAPTEAAPPAPPTPERIRPCKVKTAKRPVKTTKAILSPRHKKCQICGDPFVDDSMGKTRTVCKKSSCLKARKRLYQAAWLKKSGKKTTAVRKAPAAGQPLAPAQTINPADPALTDEQREQIKRERLACRMDE